VSREFIDAYRDLGATAPRVAFVAVNVNRYHLQVADVAAFSGEQQLTQIPAWHFLTGSYPSLRAVWQACQIEVAAPGPDADVIHSGCRSGVAGTGAGRPGLLLAKLSGMEMIWFRSRWQS
jgi:cytochrome oxidase Cu insertion factor (SCO1/SenC/PrrC family)